MKEFSPLNVINTGKDGLLHGTTREEIDAIVESIRVNGRAVWHFHGGLVSRKAGMEGAKRLHDTCYGPTGAHPLFFVWESGLVESIRHNWGEIAGEEFFKRLRDWLLKFAVGKLAAKVGAMGTGVDLPKEIPHGNEMKQAEPYVDLLPGPAFASAPELTDIEAQQLIEAVEGDVQLEAALRAILDSTAEAEQPVVTPKGVQVGTRMSAKTLMSPDRLAELHVGYSVAQPEAKGFLSVKALAKVARAVVVILRRVLSRFRAGRDHGAYTTVVEEILREYYFANIGTAVWGTMKKETWDTFQPDPAGARGGHYLLSKFGEMLKAGARPEVSLIGHSTGAVFINNLIASFAARRDAEGWPADFKFKQILFLAPACRFDNFAPTLTTHRSLFGGFRMFTMKDENESKDRLVPVVYPRSLLYAISGLLEEEVHDGKKRSASDMPIVGMERYYTRERAYPGDAFPDVATARAFLGDDPSCAVWSIAAGDGDGLRSSSVRHGDFDNDPATLASLAYLIKD